LFGGALCVSFGLNIDKDLSTVHVNVNYTANALTLQEFWAPSQPYDITKFITVSNKLAAITNSTGTYTTTSSKGRKSFFYAVPIYTRIQQNEFDNNFLLVYYSYESAYQVNLEVPKYLLEYMRKTGCSDIIHAVEDSVTNLKNNGVYVPSLITNPMKCLKMFDPYERSGFARTLVIVGCVLAPLGWLAFVVESVVMMIILYKLNQIEPDE